MAYDVYTLDGFVIDIRDSGEFDKNITFFSKDAGIVNVKAISASKPTSKMRGFLIRFCYIDIDVVHGKTGYRLIRARSFDNGFLIHKKEAYFLLCRFQKLIMMLLPEGALHSGVFNIFHNLVKHLEKNIITDNDIGILFYKYALLVLRELGYRAHTDPNINFQEQKREYEFILYENGMRDVI